LEFQFLVWFQVSADSDIGRQYHIGVPDIGADIANLANMTDTDSRFQYRHFEPWFQVVNVSIISKRVWSI